MTWDADRFHVVTFKNNLQDGKVPALKHLTTIDTVAIHLNRIVHAQMVPDANYLKNTKVDSEILFRLSGDRFFPLKVTTTGKSKPELITLIRGK